MAHVTILIGSITYSMKAKRALEKRGISARLIKASRQEGEGCTYGIEYLAKDEFAVAETLRMNGITEIKSKRVST